MTAPLTVCFAFVLLLSGCGYTYESINKNPQAPGAINHVVFFDLQDPADADELIEDCYGLLAIPGAMSGYAGRHYDIGRVSVLSDYDVGFFVAFNDEETYRSYVEHPKHIALVQKWKPRWDSIRVYDVGDARSLAEEFDQ